MRSGDRVTRPVVPHGGKPSDRPEPRERSAAGHRTGRPASRTRFGGRGAACRGGSLRRDDEGALIAFVLLLLVGLVALFGLVVDGGAALTAHQAAEVEAEQAARSGAGAIDVDALRAGTFRLDPSAAVRAAERFAAAAGHQATATVSGGVVTVTIRYRFPTTVLGIIGIRYVTVSAVAAAEDLRGVTSGVP